MYECGKLKKVLGNKLGYRVILEQFGQRFSCLLDKGIPKYMKEIVTPPLQTSLKEIEFSRWRFELFKIAQPIQPIWQHIFALP